MLHIYELSGSTCPSAPAPSPLTVCGLAVDLLAMALLLCSMLFLWPMFLRVPAGSSPVAATAWLSALEEAKPAGGSHCVAPVVAL